ncbi:hypothetical protein J3459_011469 [Metarhizium acridum]|nr:hypothetical protein J3459_011469 [Metarhizium acridum]
MKYMEYPAWYYRHQRTVRLKELTLTRTISELGEGEGDSEFDGSDVACECDGEDKCECHGQDECECDTEDECECDLWDDDEESVHSHTGSDADHYYELKRPTHRPEDTLT